MKCRENHVNSCEIIVRELRGACSMVFASALVSFSVISASCGTRRCKTKQALRAKDSSWRQSQARNSWQKPCTSVFRPISAWNWPTQAYFIGPLMVFVCIWIFGTFSCPDQAARAQAKLFDLLSSA